MSKRPPVDATTSPWHDGERYVRRRAGVEEQMEAVGPRAIVSFLLPQHRAFWASLPYGIFGTIDARGDVWATALAGVPGFMAAADRGHLTIEAGPPVSDPAAAGWIVGGSVGALGIELRTRQRIRANGVLSAVNAAGGTLEVRQAFGNCPQYIHAREARFSRDPRPSWSGESAVTLGLDDAARRLIARADTFFVASYTERRHGAGRAVDVSHRGGHPGFVRVAGDRLSIPDFPGNQYFNTLGNFVHNPRAGLMFIDFETGDLLQVTGDVAIDFDGAEARAFAGAERVWHVAVRQSVLRRSALPLQFGPADVSPNIRETDSWELARARLADAERHDPWRPYRVTRVVQESSIVRSFILESTDGQALPPSRPGQHIPVRVALPPPAGTQERLYTLSSIPPDGHLRFSVKRDGRVSAFLHEHVHAGAELSLRSPRGGFALAADDGRPLVLVSAGVGITPMVAMLRHLVHQRGTDGRVRPTWFVHAARDRSSRAFDAEVAGLVRAAGGAITHVRLLSQAGPGDVPGVQFDMPGHLDAEGLGAVAPIAGSDVYLCGPPAFMQALYGGLRQRGVPDDRIHAESFGPAGLRRDSADGTDLARPSGTPVAVTFAQSGETLLWSPADGTLLDLGTSNGLPLAASCRNGRCGTCRVPLDHGQVAYRSSPPAGLTQGTALLCQAVPAEGTRALTLSA